MVVCGGWWVVHRFMEMILIASPEETKAEGGRQRAMPADNSGRIERKRMMMTVMLDGENNNTDDDDDDAGW